MAELHVQNVLKVQQCNSQVLLVKYEDHPDDDAPLIYNGDTLEIAVPTALQQRPCERIRTCTTKSKLDSFPSFNPTQSDLEPYTQHQCYLTESFEELREKFYSMHSSPGLSIDDLDSTCDEKITQARCNPTSDLQLASTSKLKQLVLHLFEVKKRSLSFLAMNLCKILPQQTKNIDQLCSTDQSTLCPSSSSANGEPFLREHSLSETGVSYNDSLSLSSIGNCENYDFCIPCSLQRNIIQTLEKLQECMDVALNVCQKIESPLNDSSDLLHARLPNLSRLQPHQMACISELKLKLLLSLQVLKIQTMYVCNLNKMQPLLLALIGCGNSNDMKQSLSSPRIMVKKVQKVLKEEEKDDKHQVLSEEKTIQKSGIQSPEGRLECAKSTACCFLDISKLQQFLETFIQCAKILNPLEAFIVKVLCLFMQEEENSVARSLDHIQLATEKIFDKQTAVLKHHRNPLNEVQLAKTSDRLRRAGSNVVPNGVGALCTPDNHVIYKGNWKKGKRHGFGEAFIVTELHQFWSNVGEYQGNWRNNYRHGFGRMVFSDGSVYEGEWERDEIQGEGVLKRFDGCVLEGYWVGGYPNGCVKFVWQHGVMEYREYRTGELLRVWDPRLESPAATSKTLESIARSREEKAYYKHGYRTLQDELRSLKERHAQEENRSVLQERVEKLQVIDSLEQELKESQKKARLEADRVEELRKKLECHICMNKPKDCLLFPCLHFNSCMDCINLLKNNGSSLKCPTCRQLTSGEVHCKFS